MLPTYITVFCEDRLGTAQDMWEPQQKEDEIFLERNTKTARQRYKTHRERAFREQQQSPEVSYPREAIRGRNNSAMVVLSVLDKNKLIIWRPRYKYCSVCHVLVSILSSCEEFYFAGWG